MLVVFEEVFEERFSLFYSYLFPYVLVLLYIILCQQQHLFVFLKIHNAKLDVFILELYTNDLLVFYV